MPRRHEIKAGMSRRRNEGGRSSAVEIDFPPAVVYLSFVVLSVDSNANQARCFMGLSYCKLLLGNPRDPSREQIEVESLADTWAVYLIIPEHVRLQLNLEPRSQKEVTLADGGKKMVSYVGPIETRFKNRVAFVGAIVMGDEVLLGAIPMEDMDLVVMPQERRVDINPLNPNYAAGLAK